MGGRRGASVKEQSAGLPAARKRTSARRQAPSARAIPIDPFRALHFPNAIREQRRRKGYDSLLGLSALLPEIPYIRLSKIERGEVFAKATELQRIGAVLGVDAAALLVDVDAPDFSLNLWAGLRGEAMRFDREDEELAMLLAAAFRAQRAADDGLTLAHLQSRYGLPAVIVSRIENAAKPLSRWNAATVAAVCAVLGGAKRSELAAHLRALHASGALDPWLARIPGEAERTQRTRERIRALRHELARLPDLPPVDTPPNPQAKAQNAAPLMLTVCGAPLAAGLIDPMPSDQQVAAPYGYALRMCRPSLGAAIPGHAILIVDPDRFPFHGGIAVLTEGAGRRVLTVTTDREGHLIGHSLHPEKQIVLDVTPPTDLAMVTAILLG
jgi:hypothetical protein